MENDNIENTNDSTRLGKTNNITDSSIQHSFVRRRFTVSIYSTISFILIASGFTLFSYIIPKFTRADGLASQELSTIALFSIIVGSGLLLYTYLQYGFSRAMLRMPDDLRQDIIIKDYLTSRTQEVKASTMLDGIIVPSDDKKIVGDQSPPSATNLITNTNETLLPQFKILLINEDLDKSSKRVIDEIGRLTKSANVNLIFGSLTTISAVAILVVQVFYQELTFKSIPELLSHYLPRLSLIVFVEVFAFFFLRIYKSNLNDIKYFHNEKTNIEQKLLSLKIAALVGNETIIEHVIKELAKTERNFVLKKGESTIELEKEKLEANTDKNLLDSLKSLLKLKMAE